MQCSEGFVLQFVGCRVRVPAVLPGGVLCLYGVDRGDGAVSVRCVDHVLLLQSAG